MIANGYLCRFTLAVFLLITASGSAQQFDAGLRFGLTTTQVGGDQLEGFDKAGLLGGGYVSRAVSKRTSLAMEMLFVQKGSRKPVDETDNSFYRLRLSYIEVPLLLRWKASRKITLETGPAFGVLVAANEADQVGDINYAPAFENTEFSFHLGLLYFLGEQRSVNARYGFSVLPIRSFSSVSNYRYLDSGQFNEVIQLSLNYAF